MSVKVSFKYDAETRRWETIVSGVLTAGEACEAFTAVVMTCELLDAKLQPRALVEAYGEGYKIIPAV
jgi:hypothetical protein